MRKSVKILNCAVLVSFASSATFARTPVDSYDPVLPQARQETLESAISKTIEKFVGQGLRPQDIAATVSDVRPGSHKDDRVAN